MIKKIPKQPVEYVELEVGPGYVPVWFPAKNSIFAKQWRDHRVDAASGSTKRMWDLPDNLHFGEHLMRVGPALRNAWLYVPEDVLVSDAIKALNELARMVVPS